MKGASVTCHTRTRWLQFWAECESNPIKSRHLASCMTCHTCFSPLPHHIFAVSYLFGSKTWWVYVLQHLESLVEWLSRSLEREKRKLQCLPLAKLRKFTFPPVENLRLERPVAIQKLNRVHQKPVFSFLSAVFTDCWRRATTHSVLVLVLLVRHICHVILNIGLTIEIAQYTLLLSWSILLLRFWSLLAMPPVITKLVSSIPP